MMKILCILSMLIFLGKMPLFALEIPIDLEKIHSLTIQVEGSFILFDKENTHITLSPGLNLKEEEGTLYIESPASYLTSIFSSTQKHHISIGTGRDYQKIIINTGGSHLKGSLQTETLEINGGGLRLEQLQVEAQKMLINGAGFLISGTYKVQEIEIRGAGFDLNLFVEGTQKITLHGLGIDANIKYLDGWTSTRSLFLSGAGGDVTIHIPKKTGLDEEGILKVEKSSLISLAIEKY